MKYMSNQKSLWVPQLKPPINFTIFKTGPLFLIYYALFCLTFVSFFFIFHFFHLLSHFDQNINKQHNQ